MDADTARMLADLGLERRDFVSTPLERGAGDDRQTQRAAVANAEARRKNAHALAGGDEYLAEKIQAWNTKTTFESDKIAEQLEDRWSGQGHRAALSQRRRYDPRWEAVEARVGDERRMWLQNKEEEKSESTAMPSGGGMSVISSSIPSALIEGYESLAAAMKARSQGLVGVWLAFDGVWEEI